MIESPAVAIAKMTSMTAEDVATRFAALESAMQAHGEQQAAMLATLQSLAMFPDAAKAKAKQKHDCCNLGTGILDEDACCGPADEEN